MRKVAVSELKPGMVLAKDVYNPEDGRLILVKGFTLNSRYISKLETYGILYVYIEEGLIKSVTDNIQEDPAYFEALSAVKTALTSVRKGNPLEVVPIKETVNEIVEKIINNESVFNQLSGIRDIDNYTFYHSVDVCIYSVIMGKHAGLSPNELIELGMGAILHDIGKCKVPLEILTKPDRLTDDEFMTMKLHTIYGYEIISNTEGLSKQAATIACQHHEKWNGEGYPSGFKGDKIDKFARIVAVADVYDALTADRSYRKKLLPHEAAEYIIGNSGIAFDPEVIKLFMKSIVIYPTGTTVLLNTGEIGNIIETNKSFILRPKILVIAKKGNPPLPNPYIVDLMENPTVFITEVLV